MPFGPSSFDSVLAQPITPGRYVFDRRRPSFGSFTADDVMLTMRPRPLSRSAGRARRVSRSVDISVSSQARCQASSSKSSKLPAGGPPVLLTRMSMCPKRSSVRSTISCRAAGSLESPATASPLAPLSSPSIVATVSSSSSFRRANTVTLHPSRASESAVAWPMPDDAPVTIATHP